MEWDNRACITSWALADHIIPYPVRISLEAPWRERDSKSGFIASYI